MRLVVEGAGSPELPLRVLNLLAQNGVIVERAVLDLAEGGYRLVLDMSPVPAQRRALIVENIRALVLVSAVDCQAAASPCRLISESISPSSALEQTPSTNASSQPSATT